MKENAIALSPDRRYRELTPEVSPAKLALGLLNLGLDELAVAFQGYERDCFEAGQPPPSYAEFHRHQLSPSTQN
jgi:hypothetical protein